MWDNYHLVLNDVVFQCLVTVYAREIIRKGTQDFFLLSLFTQSPISTPGFGLVL